MNEADIQHKATSLEQRSVRLRNLYAAISACNMAIVRSSNEAELFAKICHTCVEFGGLKMAWIGLIDADEVKPVAAFGEGMSYLADIKISLLADSPFSRGPTGRSIHENQAQWNQTFLNDPSTAPWAQRGAEFGWRSSAALPLHRQGKPVGALSLYADEINYFDEVERRLLSEMAEDISFALDNFTLQRERSQTLTDLAHALEKANRFNHALDHISAYIFMKDTEHRYIYGNSELLKLFNCTAEELLGKADSHFFPPETAQHIAEIDHRVLSQGENTQEEVKIQDATGRSNLYWEVKTPMHSEKEPNKIIGLCGILTDITALKNAQDSLIKLSLAVEQSPNTIIITDLDANIEYANAAFTRASGYSLAEARGNNPRILQSGKTPKTTYDAMWSKLTRGEEWRGELFNKRKDGTEYIEWAIISPVRQANGEITHYLAIKENITDKRLAQAQIEKLSNFDLLTLLPNRALLEDRIKNAIAHAQQHQRFIGVLFLNLDHFSVINEMFGHAGGDEMLKIIAQRLVQAVPSDATVSRLSGDTFVIALPDLNSDKEINRLTESISQKLSQPVNFGKQNIEVGMRMGIAVYPTDGEDVFTLLKRADSALTNTKQTGGVHRICFYSANLNEHVRQLVIMGAELRDAIAHNRLVLHYQPQVDIITGAIIGAEALLRINHPQRGMIPPSEFILLAEESGLIIPLGEWALREACRQMQAWRQNNGANLIIAVNLSPLQLQQSNLVGMVSTALAESGLPAQYLELEFTESAIMHNVRNTIAIMYQFKDLGVHLSIDDFGTGYSSLSYLKQFPVDKLKIDQSFVSNISQDPNDAAIVQAIIVLAKTLGMSTIAEGVETEAQLGYLRALHCKEMQGYLYSRPLPAAAFTALLRSGKTLSENKSNKVLLLVDDEENVLMSLKRLLRREGYTILTAANAEQGLELMAANSVQVVVSDQRMPGMSGVEFLRRIKTMHPDTIRMVLSGYTEVGTLTQAINQGEIYQFITKPWENEALIAQIREAFIRYENLQTEQH